MSPQFLVAVQAPISLQLRSSIEQALSKTGGHLVEYVPDDAFLAVGGTDAIQAVSAVHGVIWVSNRFAYIPNLTGFDTLVR